MPVFVFGSNLAGRHGRGAASFAFKHHGAVYGQGVGRQGNSYAIPTKDENLRVLSLVQITEYIFKFKLHAMSHPTEFFEVTKIGCGLAGYREEQIAPLFERMPQNVTLPPGWQEIIDHHG